MISAAAIMTQSVKACTDEGLAQRMELLWTRLEELMVVNARNLRPEVAIAVLEGEVARYALPYREAQGSTAPCYVPEGLDAFVGPALTPAGMEALLEVANTVVPYDLLMPVERGSGQTYAASFAQTTILYEYEWDCEVLEVADVRLIEKTYLETNNLPPFVLPPIEYHEEWDLICDGEAMTVQALFAQDSEGFLGLR